jgi:cytochrome P450
MRRIEDLPHPRGIPILGNLLQIDAPRIHQNLESWARELGPYYRVQFGRKTVVVVSDHEAVTAVLRDRPDGFQRDPRLEEIAAEMGLPQGLFRANGDDWRRQRRMVMAAFSPSHIRRYYPSLAEVASRLSRRWSKAAAAEVPIDLQADLMRFTVDAIAGLAFGAQVNTLESEGDVIQRHLDKIFPAFFKRIMSPLPTWRWIRLPSDRRLERSVAAVLAAVGHFVRQARDRLSADPRLREQPNNLLEAMIVAADEESSGISDAQVAGNVLTMLLAGEDTTANTLAWMIDLLWRHPDSLNRARDEVRGVVPPREIPTLEQLDQLPFLDACTHETMRLKPVAPFMGLQPLRDAVIGDVQVPKGTLVLNLMRCDGVSESRVTNAASFDPTRWYEESGGQEQAGQLKRLSIPFGAGPRICPGRYLALLEIKLAMATLLSRFDIASVDTVDGSPVQERMAFTMTPVGLRMRLRERA